MSKPSLKLGVYRHYSGKFYEVLGIAHHSETLEPLVVYQGLYECEKFGPNPLWVRPFQMFVEKITINGKEQARFEFVSEALATSTLQH